MDDTYRLVAGHQGEFALMTETNIANRAGAPIDIGQRGAMRFAPSLSGPIDLAHGSVRDAILWVRVMRIRAATTAREPMTERPHVQTIAIYPGGHSRDRDCLGGECAAQPSGTQGPAHAVTLASIKDAIEKATGAESATIELSTTAKTLP
jgi:hypothetical protein